MKLTRIAERIFNKPLMIDELTMEALLSGMSDRFGISEIEGLDGNEIVPEAFASGGNDSGRPYGVYDGVAVIPVEGKLVNKSGYLQANSGIQGYDGLLAQYSMALSDGSVDKILFDFNSGGGEVAGCFDLCDLIYAHRDEKETIAFVGEHACSAAYALASSCSKVITPRTGVLGSIGVLVAHTDVSKKMEDEGVKVTLIHSGSAKVEGNAFEPLPEAVKEKIQGQIDATRDLFAETVARNRGMSKDAVLKTEANVYQGDEAVKLGLADSVMSFNEVLITMTDVNKGATEELGAAMEGQAEVQPELSLEGAVVAAEDVIDFDPSALASLCKEHNAEHLLANFIESMETMEGAMTIIKQNAELRDVLVAAEFSPEQIASVEGANSPAEFARAMFSAKEESEEILSIIPEKEKAEKSHNFYAFEKKV